MEISEREKKIRYAAYEIIDTEKNYLSRLQAVHDVYYVPLSQKLILDRDDLDLQFGCLDTLLKISTELYTQLAPQRDSETPKIGEIFLKFCEVRSLYVLLFL